MKKIIVAITILIFLTAAAYAAETGTVTADVLKVRTSPEIRPDNLLTRVMQGSEVSIVDSNGEWIKIKTTSGATGWVKAEYVKRAPAAAPAPQPATETTADASDTGRVDADNLNLRSSPEINSGNLVSQLPRGSLVTVIEDNGQWMKIKTKGGAVGWVASVYIDRGRDKSPDTLLKTAQDIFHSSYRKETVTTIQGIEEYKVYNPRKVMEAYNILNKALSNTNLERMDMALLLRGKCMSVIGWYGYEFDRSFFNSMANEFEANSAGGNYIYKGRDFKALLEKFPGSNLTDDAAFELSSLPQAGSCSDAMECVFQRNLDAFRPFFKSYPGSPLVVQAIEVINASSVDVLLAESDLSGGSAGTYTFKRDTIINLLAEYRAMMQGLTSEVKLQALHPIAGAYAALGEPEKALEVFEAILKYYPKYEHIDQIKDSIKILKDKKKK